MKMMMMMMMNCFCGMVGQQKACLALFPAGTIVRIWSHHILGDITSFFQKLLFFILTVLLLTWDISWWQFITSEQFKCKENKIFKIFPLKMHCRISMRHQNDIIILEIFKPIDTWFLCTWYLLQKIWISEALTLKLYLIILPCNAFIKHQWMHLKSCDCLGDVITYMSMITSDFQIIS